MGVTQRQTQQLQPRRLPERVPGSFLLQQLQTFSSTSQTPRTTVKMAVSKIRQNYHEDCEALINKQINMEFYASYVYLSMSSYFNRDDQALHGFAEHFKKGSGEERAHGMKLMEYQTKRGGRVVFQDVAKAIGDLIVKMKRAGDGLGLYLIDKE